MIRFLANQRHNTSAVGGFCCCGFLRPAISRVPPYVLTSLLLSARLKRRYIDARVYPVTVTQLMNIGLLYTPVSIYQMTRGALVLFVGILSVIFLRRRLWLYQFGSSCLVLLTPN
jgi:drug/metabolite transporter (DMT)-like permease